MGEKSIFIEKKQEEVERNYTKIRQNVPIKWELLN